MSDTIAAQATPAGYGGVGIVRISGPEALLLAQKITCKKTIKPRSAIFSQIFDHQGEYLDEGLVLHFPAPASFTGEHVVEFQLHGSPVVIDLLLKSLVLLGVRLARPGEFSERAFLNNKIDLVQAEAIADLIESQSETAAKMAGRSLQGTFSKYVHALVDKVIQLRMYVEAAIDFPEEEIDFISDGHVENQLNDIIRHHQELIEKANQGKIIKEGMKLVIAGQPNAGKSSLLNVLSDSDTAIVTDVAGTTRDILKEEIQIEGMPVHLIDTAGIRETENIIEQEGIKRAKHQLEQADHIFWVYDAKQDPEDQSHDQSYAWSKLPKGIDVTFIRNKIDLLNEKPSVEKNRISVSAKSNQGIQLIRDHLKNVMGYKGQGEGEFLARRRHMQSLGKAEIHLAESVKALHNNHEGEIIAEELRLAQNALNEITGEFSSDDLLGEIFSSFCIGK